MFMILIIAVLTYFSFDKSNNTNIHLNNFEYPNHFKKMLLLDISGFAPKETMNMNNLLFFLESLFINIIAFIYTRFLFIM